MNKGERAANSKRGEGGSRCKKTKRNKTNQKEVTSKRRKGCGGGRGISKLAQNRREEHSPTETNKTAKGSDCFGGGEEKEAGHEQRTQASNSKGKGCGLVTRVAVTHRHMNTHANLGMCMRVCMRVCVYVCVCVCVCVLHCDGIGNSRFRRLRVSVNERIFKSALQLVAHVHCVVHRLKKEKKKERKRGGGEEQREELHAQQQQLSALPCR